MLKGTELVNQLYFIGGLNLPENEEQTVEITLNAIANSLRYLDIFLTNRRGYQRKNQMKRKALFKLADELKPCP